MPAASSAGGAPSSSASASSSSPAALGAAGAATLSSASDAAAIAPDSMTGWSTLQRALNTILPMRLDEAERLLEQADRTLAGTG